MVPAIFATSGTSAASSLELIATAIATVALAALEVQNHRLPWPCGDVRGLHPPSHAQSLNILNLIARDLQSCCIYMLYVMYRDVVLLGEEASQSSRSSPSREDEKALDRLSHLRVGDHEDQLSMSFLAPRTLSFQAAIREMSHCPKTATSCTSHSHQ